MKKLLFFTFFLCFYHIAFAQKKPTKITANQSSEIKFSKTEQQEIQKILGDDYTTVLGNDGQLAIVNPQSVGNIKSSGKGNFSTLAKGSNDVGSTLFVAYEKAWVYRQGSGKMLVSKLGQQRFKQLKAVMSAKGVKM